MTLGTRILTLAAGLALGFGVPAAAAEEIELEDVAVFIEWNSKDTDYGIQFFWDSPGFTKMKVSNESGKTVLDVRTKKNVKDQGLTEGFFESVEPPSSVLSMEAFFERFPEGDYGFKGKGLNRETLVGETEFTHVLPAPPENLFPSGSDVVSHLGFQAGFDPVTQDTEGNAIDIEEYVLVVERTDDGPPGGLEVVLPPEQTSVAVPGAILAPNATYKLEIIAQEESGNRTISETDEFTTDGPL